MTRQCGSICRHCRIYLKRDGDGEQGFADIKFDNLKIYSFFSLYIFGLDIYYFKYEIQIDNEKNAAKALFLLLYTCI